MLAEKPGCTPKKRTQRGKKAQKAAPRRGRLEAESYWAMRVKVTVAEYSPTGGGLEKTSFMMGAMA